MWAANVLSRRGLAGTGTGGASKGGLALARLVAARDDVGDGDTDDSNSKRDRRGRGRPPPPGEEEQQHHQKYAPATLVRNPYRSSESSPGQPQLRQAIKPARRQGAIKHEADHDEQHEPPTAPKGWKALRLPYFLEHNLSTHRYRAPSVVQLACIPLLLSGRDVALQAATGTGKTLSYVLPLLASLDHTSPGPQAVIVTPTRELAMQVSQVVRSMARATSAKRKPFPIRVTTVVGNLPSEPLRRLMTGPTASQVVVGTPISLANMFAQQEHGYRWSRVATVVLDEADYALEQQDRTVDCVHTLFAAKGHPRPWDVQRVVVSATITPEVVALADRHLKRDYVRTGPGLFAAAMQRATTREPAAEVHLKAQLAVAASGHLPAAIQHVGLRPLNRRPIGGTHEERVAWDVNLFTKWYAAAKPTQVLCFCNATDRMDVLRDLLEKKHFRTGVLSSELMSDGRRTVLDQFRERSIQILLTTEMGSRGLDLPNVSHVYNFGTPRTPTIYIHRAGRTGRLNPVSLVHSKGTVVTPLAVPAADDLVRVLARKYDLNVEVKTFSRGTIEAWSDEKHKRKDEGLDEDGKQEDTQADTQVDTQEDKQTDEEINEIK